MDGRSPTPTGAPRVLLVAFHYRPEISAGVQRAEIMEEFLVRRGCAVTVLVHQEADCGVHGAGVLRVPLPGYLAPRDAAAFCSRGASRLRRWVRQWLMIPDVFVAWSLRAGRAASRQAAQTPFDLVITSSPPESVHAIGWRLKRRQGVRWLADFRDGWTLEPHRPEVNLPIRRWVDRRLERAVVEGADWLTVNTRPIAEDFAARFPAAQERIHVLPTGFAREGFEPRLRDDRLFRLVYTGRFGLSWQQASPAPFFQGLRVAMESDRAFAARFRLILVGSFTDEEKASWHAPPLADVVQELPPCPYEEAMQYAAGATMLLVVPPRGLRSVVPRKLFDYLAVRRPILAVSEENEVTRILDETSAGVWSSPADPPRLAQVLVRLFRLWQSGRLDEEMPCSGNDAYRAERHFERVLGQIVLAQLSERAACRARG